MLMTISLPRVAGNMVARMVLGLLGMLAVIGSSESARAAEMVNIYSHRQPFLIQPFLDAFTAETGIETRVVFASKGLAQRLEAEGAASPADVVLTVDIARLRVYADRQLLRPVSSPVLDRIIPQSLRSPDNTWFAFSLRSRVIATSLKRVDADAVSRVEDLADPAFKGRLCTRPGSHVYNRALLASVIAAHGQEAATDWARGVVSNLARRPQGNDRAQAKAIFQGECDIAIMNHYYYGNMLNGDKADQRQWAQAIRIIFPNQGEGDRGAHVNISGGGIARYSKNPEAAQRFLEFLVSPKAQRLYADINYEYPVNPAVELPQSLKLWGSFRPDTVSINKLADLAPTAQRIIDTVGW